MEVVLGSEIKDMITGFKGIATARCEYINGCVQYEVTPQELKGGAPVKVYWVDEHRVILLSGVEEKKEKEKEKKKKKRRKPPGGPQNHPDKKNPPSLAGYGE